MLVARDVGVRLAAVDVAKPDGAITAQAFNLVAVRPDFPFRTWAGTSTARQFYAMILEAPSPDAMRCKRLDSCDAFWVVNVETRGDLCINWLIPVHAIVMDY